MAEQQNTYPVRFDVDYPDEPLDRLSSFFRLLFAIPILILIGMISGEASENARDESVAAGGLLFIAPMLMIVFRQKYPRWWFDWILEFLKFSNRVTAYLLLLRDEYPSTDEEQAVHLDIPYPDAREGLNRWLPLAKWFLAIPHYIVLVFLAIAVLVVVVIAWIAILFTGRYPRDLFDFVVGAMRWTLRVEGYALALVTDRYPPFRLTA